MQMLSLIALALDISCKLITLAAKRRRKGMVIILCVCLHVCVCSQNFGKLQTLVGRTSYWQTSNYTRIKINKRLLLKPFSYKDFYNSRLLKKNSSVHRHMISISNQDPIINLINLYTDSWIMKLSQIFNCCWISLTNYII